MTSTSTISSNSVLEKAVRPPDDGERKYFDQYSWVCQTCHCTVTEQCIGGIWTHLTTRYKEKGEDCDHNCTKLIPMKSADFNRDTQWKCFHEIRFVDGMTKAVKCLKCEKVYYSYELMFGNTKGDFFCVTCDKSFKRMGTHVKTSHAGKLFEMDFRAWLE